MSNEMRCGSGSSCDTFTHEGVGVRRWSGWGGSRLKHKAMQRGGETEGRTQAAVNNAKPRKGIYLVTKELGEEKRKTDHALFRRCGSSARATASWPGWRRPSRG